MAKKGTRYIYGSLEQRGPIVFTIDESAEITPEMFAWIKERQENLIKGTRDNLNNFTGILSS